jgi:predicted DNA-binding transcriptional regulator AlpA
MSNETSAERKLLIREMCQRTGCSYNKAWNLVIRGLVPSTFEDGKHRISERHLPAFAEAAGRSATSTVA